MNLQIDRKELAAIAKWLHYQPRAIQRKLKQQGIEMSQTRIRQIRNVLNEKYIKTHTLELPFAANIKWEDPAPTSHKKWPIYESMMRKFEKENKLPAWRR